MGGFYPDVGPISRFQDPIVEGEETRYSSAKISGKMRYGLFEMRIGWHGRGFSFRGVTWWIGPA